MSNRTTYQLFTQLDAPKRFLSLTVDELAVAIIGFSMLSLTNYKVLSALFGLGLIFVLRLLKRGKGPNALLVLAYWHLPHVITRFFLPRLPASHHRIYIV
jgi:conjugal transfer pilus assembly protein TraL